MSFAGHVLDSIKRTQYNRSLKVAHHDKIQKVRTAYMAHIHIATNEKTPQLSKEELTSIKQKLRLHLQHERRIQYMRIFLISFITIALLLFLFFRFFIKSVSIFV